MCCVSTFRNLLVSSARNYTFLHLAIYHWYNSILQSKCHDLIVAKFPYVPAWIPFPPGAFDLVTNVDFGCSHLDGDGLGIALPRPPRFPRLRLYYEFDCFSPCLALLVVTKRKEISTEADPLVLNLG